MSLLLVLPVSSYALETDNYLSWDKDLADSGEEINKLIRNEIEAVLEWSNTLRDPQSCEAITFQIAHRFKTTPRRKLFEDMIPETLNEEMMYPVHGFYLGESIYRHTSRVYMKYSGLSPNVQTNGFYFGVDKLSHFGSTGRRYLKHYLKKIREGFTPLEAEQSAVLFGLSNEGGILGLWASGVFSYGDMEANYQGFLFYKKLCMDSGETYLKNTDDKWILQNAPDIRDFVNPFWDETYNRSFMSAGMWGRSQFIIKDEYCSMKNDPRVQSRFAHYDAHSSNKSFSLKYIEELRSTGNSKVPEPQKVCE